MSQPTQPYKRSLSGSVGAGMKSVLGGEGKRFYTLVHKVSSKYHKAGESQQIIVDQIELGRDPRCQVRFDESFTTVSRRHAAIVKDGDNWKLVQLSKVNSTYLNGHKVQNEWYLQNGDEIQLSTNGPKLGFIIPEGKKGTVGSIGLTARLNLFRKQALRPYKNAIWGMAAALLIIVGVGGFALKNQSDISAEQAKLVAQDRAQIDELIAESAVKQEEIDQLRLDQEQSRKMAEAANRRAAAAEAKAKEIRSASVAVDFTDCFKDIFFIKLYKITINGETVFEVDPDKGWLICGTGFLLNDGRFVTARHVINPSYYSNDYHFTKRNGWSFNANSKEDFLNIKEWLTLNFLAMRGRDVVFHFKAYSNISTISFTDKDFCYDDSQDDKNIFTAEEDVTVEVEKEQIVMIPKGDKVKFGPTGKYDWAYIPSVKGGSLVCDKTTSLNPKQGTTLYIIGYPYGRGEGNPILSTALCSQNGLDVDGTIMASNDNTEGGNSGGPVFIIGEDGKKYVVGIVSGSIHEKGRFVPIGHVK